MKNARRAAAGGHKTTQRRRQLPVRRRTALVCAVVILSLECCSKPVIDFVVLHFILSIFLLFTCTIV